MGKESKDKKQINEICNLKQYVILRQSCAEFVPIKK